jgi:ribosomal protein S18 acetylase RimI-like enzyme
MDGLSATRRTSQVYYEQIGEPTNLDHGVAFTCDRYPLFHDGNLFHDVLIRPESSLEAAWAEAEAFYAERGLTCWQWAPNEDQAIEPMAAFLHAKGFATETSLAMELKQYPEAEAFDEVRIIPARAMRKAYRQLLAEEVGRYSEAEQGGMIGAGLDRADDASYDMHVAMIGGEPAGQAALFQVGDICSIEDVYVSPAHRRKKVGTAIMHHLLQMARRLDTRMVCLRVLADNKAAKDLYRSLGFTACGEMTRFRRSAKG